MPSLRTGAGSPGPEGRVRLGNVPNTCAVNPRRHDSPGTVWSETGDVSGTFQDKGERYPFDFWCSDNPMCKS